MSLTIPSPPPQGFQIVRDAVGGVLNQQTRSFQALREAAPESLVAAVPHPVYIIGLEDLVAGASLASAILVGWRYLLLSDERSLVAAEVNVGTQTEQVEFSHINQGPFVESTVAAIQFAETLEAVRQDDYELRLLKIPALYVVALWLRGSDSIVIPLAPTRDELDPNTDYREDAFLDLLRRPAEERLRQEGSDLPERLI